MLSSYPNYQSGTCRATAQWHGGRRCIKQLWWTALNNWSQRAASLQQYNNFLLAPIIKPFYKYNQASNLS